MQVFWGLGCGEVMEPSSYIYKNYTTTTTCWFPITAVTNCHNPSGLKQHKCIISQFCISEAWKGSHWAKMTCQQCCIPSGGSREESISFLSSFRRLTAFLTWGPLHIQSHQSDHSNLCFCHYISDSDAPAFPFCLQGPFQVTLHWAHLEDSPISRSLIASAKSILSC